MWGQPCGVLTPGTAGLAVALGVSEHENAVRSFWGVFGTACFPTPLPQQGARVFGALGPIGPSSPGLALGGLVVGEHRLSHKLLAWSGVLEWQEVSGPSGPPRVPVGLGVALGAPACPCGWRAVSSEPSRHRSADPIRTPRQS